MAITDLQFERLKKSHLHQIRSDKFATWKKESSVGDNWIASNSIENDERLISTMDESTKEIDHEWLD